MNYNSYSSFSVVFVLSEIFMAFLSFSHANTIKIYGIVFNIFRIIQQIFLFSFIQCIDGFSLSRQSGSTG